MILGRLSSDMEGAAMKRVLGSLVLLGGALLGPLAGQCLDGDGSWVRPEGVLFGNPQVCQKPAMVDFQKVWSAIPEVVRIKRDHPGPAEKDILLAKATARFKAAVRRAAFAGGYDCVVMKRAILGKPPVAPVDITRELIRLVKR